MIKISETGCPSVVAGRLTLDEKSNGLGRPDEIFKLLVDAVDEYAIFAMSPEGRILTWNAGAQRLKGYSCEEAIGRHFSMFYTQPDIDRGHPRHELEIAAERGKYEEEGWRVRKDGTSFWANVVITALRDSSGTLKGFGKVTRDMTERKEAERLLRESEERFRLMIEEVQDYAIFMLDPEGRVATWNAGAERNKGYQAGEIIGKHFSQFFPEEEKQAGKPQRELKEAVAKGRFEDEGWRIRKDGSKFWANVIITPMFDKSRKLIGFSKVTRNLTERKKAEDSLKEAYADLENKIAARTNELKEAKDRAESAVKARDEFFSMASHELKTPISALKLQTQLRRRKIERGNLQDFSSAERLLELCNQDERQVERLRFLVDNMLDVSMLTSGKFELILETLDLTELAEDVIRRLQPMLRSSGSEISLVAPKTLVGTWDRFRLEQVLTNLLSNAGKYAAGKPIEVELQALPSSARILVKDQGRGISKDDQARIFAPFERVKDKGATSGLGLGLHITRQIVETHGGVIGIESELGKGSTFIIEIPLSAEPQSGNG